MGFKNSAVFLRDDNALDADNDNSAKKEPSEENDVGKKKRNGETVKFLCGRSGVLKFAVLCLWTGCVESRVNKRTVVIRKLNIENLGFNLHSGLSSKNGILSTFLRKVQ